MRGYNRCLHTLHEITIRIKEVWQSQHNKAFHRADLVCKKIQGVFASIPESV